MPVVDAGAAEMGSDLRDTEDERPSGHVFISHATPDAVAAATLAAELKAAGCRCWLSGDDIPVGANYAEEIIAGMNGAVACAVLLSRAAAESPHVRREVNLAIDMRKLILPLSLDAGIRAANDLPGDWRYWLGVVQIHAYRDARHAAGLVGTSLERAGLGSGEPGGSKDRSRDGGGAGAPDRSGATPSPPARSKGKATTKDDRIRHLLIQVGASACTFKLAVERGRGIGATADEVRTVAQRLRDGRLLDFDGDLEPDTVIRLT